MPQNGERLSRAEEGTAIKLEGRNLPPRSIVIQKEWNPRVMSSDSVKQSIESLKQSIRARINAGLPGLFKPIQVRYIRSTAPWRGATVTGGTPLLVDGERRLLAYLQLWDEGTEANIPVTDTDGDEAQLRAASIIANDGLPLTALEIGRQCKILRDGCCKSVEWIAENIGKSQRFVTEAIALHDAPEEAKALVASGEVTPSAVRSAWKAEVKQAQEENRAPEPERIVEPLKQAVASQPQPAHATIPRTVKPSKQKPVARPKAESKCDREIKTVLALADDLAAKALDDELPISDVWKAAKAYQKARGI
jgi:hypothetical protein